jgi:hypothetical protein
MRQGAIPLWTLIACLLSLWGCAASDSGAARDAASCPRAAPPSYVVKTLLPAPIVDDSMTLDQIARLSNRSYRYLTLGATESKFLVIGIATPRIAPALDSGACAYATKVSLTLALGKRVIHIAREFESKEPCVYGEVLDHERHHATLDDEILGEERARLPSVLPQRFADLDGVWGKNAAAARDNLRHRLDQDDEALRVAIEARRHREQAAEVDTLTERHRLLAACDGRLHQLYPEFH